MIDTVLLILGVILLLGGIFVYLKLKILFSSVKEGLSLGEAIFKALRRGKDNKND